MQAEFPHPEDWLTGAPQMQLRIKDIIGSRRRENVEEGTYLAPHLQGLQVHPLEDWETRLF